MATYSHNTLDVTPLMTSNTAPSPNVVSASSSYGPLPPWHAFTHNYNNAWATSGSAAGWLKFDLGSGNASDVDQYTVTCGDGAILARAPKTWTLQGSNNDSDWDVLDTQTNVPVWTALGEMRTYNISSPASYRYYIINVTASQGSGYMTIGEIELLGSGLTEINIQDPFSVDSNIHADIVLELSVGAFISTGSISINEPCIGTIISCPSPLTATTSLQSDIGVSVGQVLFQSQTILYCEPMLSIDASHFSSNASICIDSPKLGHIIYLPNALLLNSSIDLDLKIGIVETIFTSNSGLHSNPCVSVPSILLTSNGSISATVEDPFSVATLPRIYTLTITGSGNGIDDIIIPMGSFQLRKNNVLQQTTMTYPVYVVDHWEHVSYTVCRNREQHFISVVIPSFENASEINARTRGALYLRMGYLSNSNIILSNIIGIASFDKIIINEGATNKSITLEGHGDFRLSGASSEITLSSPSYMNVNDGELRYRCEPNLYLKPGDYASINDDRFRVRNITWTASPESETFEVSE